MPREQIEDCACKRNGITEIKVAKIGEGAKIPLQALPGDAGFDIFSNEDSVIIPGTSVTIGSGCRVKIPSGCVGLVCPRSGLASKYSLTVGNAPGILDSGYTGELKVILINHGTSVYTVNKGDKVAQLVVVRFESPLTIEISGEDMDALNTIRSGNGFGSTGN